MGKVKNRKSRNRRSRPKPTAIPSEKDLEEEIELNGSCSENNVLESAVEKLQSCSPEDKECGAVIIALRAGNPDFITQFIQQNVVRVAAPLLLDKSTSVRHAICGSLRNISSYGGHDVSQAMVEQDVMTPLVSLLKQYNSPWTAIKSLDDKIDSKSEIFLEACHLLWNLCESCSRAVDIFNQSDLFSILIPCIDIKVFSLEIVIAVLQCLYSVTECNSDAIHKSSQTPVFEVLQSFVCLSSDDIKHVLLKNLAAGILFNISSDKIDRCELMSSKNIVKVIDETLEIPIILHLQKLSSVFFAPKSEISHEKNGEMEIMKADMTATSQGVEQMLLAKQIALELLTNLCCHDANESDDAESSDMSDDMYIEEEMSSMPLNFCTTSPELHELIVQSNLLGKVLKQNIVPDALVSKQLTEFPEGRDALKRLHTVRCRTLLCMNNLLQNMDVNEIGPTDEVFQLWMELINVLFTHTDPGDDEQLEAVTCSVRAVLMKLAETNCSSYFSRMTESDLIRMFDIYLKSEVTSVKVNIVRSVATLGCILSSMVHPNFQKLITIIGSFLIDMCMKCSDLWILAETLDAIFDVFAEDHLDSIAKEIHLVDKLQHLLPILKGKIKQRRKSLGPHLPIIMTAKMNLVRFIKYKNNIS